MITANFRDLGLGHMLDKAFDIAGLFDKEIELKQPYYNLKDDKLELSYDLPGASKEQIEINTQDQILIVKGIGGRYGGLQTKLKIHQDYDIVTADASLKDGVLTVVISKAKKTPTNKIQIK